MLRMLVNSRTVAWFLALGPLVITVEWTIARRTGWIHAAVPAWIAVALTVACWEWAAVAWAHEWLKGGGEQAH